MIALLRSCIQPQFFVLIIAVGVISSTQAASADDINCNEAISGYNFTLIKHEEALTKYTTCLKFSQGRQSCSHEFDELTESQHWFQTDVNAINEWCSRD